MNATLAVAAKPGLAAIQTARLAPSSTMKFLALATLLSAALLAGCQKPEETVIPADSSKWEETLKPVVQSLSAEDRNLLAGYLVRQKLAKTESPIGISVGAAIADQRQWVEAKNKRDAEERARLAETQAKARVIADEMRAKEKAASDEMRAAVTVTVVKKALREDWGASGRVKTDEVLDVTFGYQNNTDKPIKGVKGLIVIKDMFGDKLSAFAVSNDKAIPAKGRSTWTGGRSVQYAFGSDNKDRKFAELADDAYQMVWEPEVILFADGTRLPAAK